MKEALLCAEGYAVASPLFERLRVLAREIRRLRAAAPVGGALLREVMAWHADPKSPDYNGCDKERCNWCERASAALSAERGQK